MKLSLWSQSFPSIQPPQLLVRLGLLIDSEEVGGLLLDVVLDGLSAAAWAGEAGSVSRRGLAGQPLALAVVYAAPGGLLGARWSRCRQGDGPLDRRRLLNLLLRLCCYRCCWKWVRGRLVRRGRGLGRVARMSWCSPATINSFISDVSLVDVLLILFTFIWRNYRYWLT